MSVVGYQGFTKDKSTIEERDLNRMLYKHPAQKSKAEQRDFFVERVQGEALRLYYGDLLVREWRWGSEFIECFFEEITSIDLNEEEMKYLASGEEMIAGVDAGYFYAPYLPLFNPVVATPEPE